MPGIWVLADTNGAGKSSIDGELLRRAGGVYFNPDEVARHLRQMHPGLVDPSSQCRRLGGRGSSTRRSDSGSRQLG